MTQDRASIYLEDTYHQANNLLETQEMISIIPSSVAASLTTIIKHSQSSKAVCTVALTSLVYKLLEPSQDIRCHQTSIPNGYSGRTFDVAVVTPFMKAQRFPAMAESGWLTRSLEQKMPYDRSYPGAIKPIQLKEAFLDFIDYIEHSTQEDRKDLLLAFLQCLIKQRALIEVDLATPTNLTITQIVYLLKRHFEYKYTTSGAARLPVLALYAVYQSLVSELKRFEDKDLLTLESHTSADRRSGRMGDLDIVNKDGMPFEAVEIKMGIPISMEMIDTAYEKFKSYPSMERYYILSTAVDEYVNTSLVQRRIQGIKNTHGCQIIANGIYSTLKYYLRLLDDPNSFVQHYVDCLSTDEAIKFDHRKYWNDLVREIGI